MGFADDLVSSLDSAPELQQSPDLALASAQSSDPSGNAQVLSHTANTYAMDKSFGVVGRHVHSGLLPEALGWLGGAVHHAAHALGTGASFGLHLLNTPLQEVQHEYRYLHDVEATHGPLAAMLEGLGVAAGAVAGSFIPGAGTAAGAIIGGELTGQLLGRVSYQDSFARTRPGVQYRDPNTNAPVSMGRDLASVLGLKRGSKPYTLLSGTGDFVSDMTLDPLVQLGGIAKEAQLAKVTVSAPEDVARAYEQSGAFQRAVKDMAGSNAGEIVRKYPKIAQLGRTVVDETGKPVFNTAETLVRDLGQAQTDDQVLDVFRQNMKAEQLTGRSTVLPTLSLTKLPIRALGGALQDVEGSGPLSTRIANAVRKQTLLPTALDADTLKLSAQVYDPASDQAAAGIHKMVRLFESQKVADSVTNEWLNSDPGRRIVIGHQAILNGLIGMGIPEDNEVVANLAHELDQMQGGAMIGQSAHYGFDMAGKPLSPFQTKRLTEVSAGIFGNQTGMQAFPDFHAVQDLRRSLNNSARLFGKADDFFWQHFTYPVFKRFTLLTGGFAERMAASELIPNMLRLGPTNVVRSMAARSAAKLAIAAPTEEELPHLLAAVQRARGWATNLLADPEKTELAMKSIQMKDGHLVSPALGADHHYSGQVMDSVTRQQNSLFHAVQDSAPVRTTDRFRVYTQGDEHFGEAWHAAVAEARNDPHGAAQAAAGAYLDQVHQGADQTAATTAAQQAAKAKLDAIPPRQASMFIRSTDGTTDDWASTVSEAVKGLVHGQDGTLHVPMLRSIANPDEAMPHLDAFKNVELDQQPIRVKGRVLEPVPAVGMMERVATAGYNRVLSPFINYMSREPLYLTELDKAYEPFRAAVKAGTLTEADALHQAEIRATQNLLPFIHNTLERTQFAEAARNLMPFWFAQQQAYKRFGRLLIEDPAAFRRFQLMSSSLTDLGHHAQDSQGGNWFNYPGTGMLGLGVPKILSGIGIPMTSAVPVSFAGDLTSLNTVFPGSEGVRPGLGPVVTIPLHLMESFMPESRPVVKEIIGPQSEGQALWKQIVPNTFLQRTVEAFAGQHSQSFQSAMMNTIQEMEYQQTQHPDRQIVPGPDANPMQQQQFIDRVKNQTRVNFLLRAVIGAVTPASPQFKIGNVKFRQEVRDLIKQKGLTEGVNQFLTEHPDATAYTVFQSQAAAGGAPLSATAKAEDFYNAHRATLDKYPYAGAWLIPQSNEPFNQAVYNEQLAQGLRQHKAPDQFLKDLYIAAGNRQYFNVDLPTRDQAIADANGDKNKIAAIHSDWSKYVQSFGLQNPVWWDNFTSSSRQHERMLAIQQLDEMFARNDAPASKHTDDIRGLVDDYHTFAANMPQGQDTQSASMRELVKADFSAYLENLAKDKPNLAPLIKKVFSLEVSNPFTDTQAA